MGSNFVKYTLAHKKKYAITILDSLTYAGRLENLDGVFEQVTFVHGSINDKNLVDNLVRNSDVVVNFAAETHNDNSLENPIPFYETNLIGTLLLAEASRKHSVRIHQISTDEVYGDLPIDSNEKFTENSNYNPSSPYSASKAAADQLLLAWHRSFGLQVTVSNSANNFGPNQNFEKLIPKSIELLKQGRRPKIYGNGKNVRDWLHVDDHSSAILAILESGRIGHKYLVSSFQLRTNLEIIGTLNESFGMQADYIEFIADRAGHDRKYSSDSSKLRNDTGWKPESESIESFLKRQTS